jgi:hypothetical protein
VALKVNTLTLGEIAKFEDLSGQTLDSLSDGEKPKGLALAAMAFVAKRREDPKFSWNDAQNLTLADIDGLLEGDDEPVDDGLAALTGEEAPKAPSKRAPKTSQPS